MKSTWSTNTYQGPALNTPWRWAERGMVPAVANPRPEALYRKPLWPRPHHYYCIPNPNVSSSPVAYRLTPLTVSRLAANNKKMVINVLLDFCIRHNG